MVGMSNFTLDPSILGNGGTKRHELERKALVDELLAVVKESQKKYGSKTELATENDSRILLLCETWERVLSHGLKSNSTMLKSVADLVAGGGLEIPVFWDFAFKHLTNHEKERFSALRHVWTNSGKGKALLRAILNERALERYMLIWLGDVKILEESYEPWALMRDPEIVSLLPNMAAGLSTILFAISVDAPELNAAIKVKVEKAEPIIATRAPAGPARKMNIVAREILEENTTQPILNLSSSPGTSQITIRRTNSIDIKEYTHIESNPQPREVYSVEDALNSLTITRRKSRESVPDRDGVATSPDNALEASEDSIIGNYSMNSSTATTTTATSNASSSMASFSESSANDTTEEHGLGLQSEAVEKLKRKLTDSEERCQMLEARVAELSLENNRLRMLTRSNRLSLMHFQICIPKAILRTPVSGHRRQHYCYEIRVTPTATGTNGGDCWSVFRRYSDFYRLHKTLQKEYPSVKTLDFPPKKKFGNMNAQYVEQRRQRLQVYLNSLFITVLPEVSACNTRSQLERAFPFLRDAIL
ncbi:sorting nexin-29 [Toxorhynchites rutilus septentrionalis]|uniref:sorting nexin-29 n=1 Tax=Toxorhynchites rutilus septentrionalis TaxID=329112 RepID=UPI002479C520|nr:sorting nexin-29 [Toxorhynchites rutilus septentrionalis]